MFGGHGGSHHAFRDTQDSIARWHWRRSSGTLAETQYALARHSQSQKDQKISPFKALLTPRRRDPSSLLRTIRHSVLKWEHRMLWRGFSAWRISCEVARKAEASSGARKRESDAQSVRVKEEFERLRRQFAEKLQRAEQKYKDQITTATTRLIASVVLNAYKRVLERTWMRWVVLTKNRCIAELRQDLRRAASKPDKFLSARMAQMEAAMARDQRNAKIKAMILQRLMSGKRRVLYAFHKNALDSKAAKLELAARNKRVKEMILQRLMSGKRRVFYAFHKHALDSKAAKTELAARNKAVQNMILTRLMSGTRQVFYAFHKNAADSKVEKIELAVRNAKIKEMILQRFMSGKRQVFYVFHKNAVGAKIVQMELEARNKAVQSMILTRLMSGKRHVLYAFKKNAADSKLEKMELEARNKRVKEMILTRLMSGKRHVFFAFHKNAMQSKVVKMKLEARNKAVQSMILTRFMSGKRHVFYAFLKNATDCKADKAALAARLEKEKIEITAREDKIKSMILQRLMSGKRHVLYAFLKNATDCIAGRAALAVREERVKDHDPAAPHGRATTRAACLSQERHRLQSREDEARRPRGKSQDHDPAAPHGRAAARAACFPQERHRLQSRESRAQISPGAGKNQARRSRGEDQVSNPAAPHERQTARILRFFQARL